MNALDDIFDTVSEGKPVFFSAIDKTALNEPQRGRLVEWLKGKGYERGANAYRRERVRDAVS